MVLKRNCIILLGKHHVERQEASQQTSLISEYFVHEDYIKTNTQSGNDLALLKLDTEIAYDANVQPACLPFGLPELTNRSVCFATGWGRFIAG